MPELPRRDLDEIIERTEGIWRRARGARIFLTGGTGFIGSWLMDSFASANHRLNLNMRMVTLTRQSRASPDPAIEFHCGDIRTFDFPDGDFSHVIHGANAALRDTAMEETIVAGTGRLQRFCEAHPPARFLYLSSGAVYGLQPGDGPAVSEEAPLGAPENGYARAKQLAEEMCGAFPATIARGFAFLGPRLPLESGFAAGNFIRDRLACTPIHLAGSGKAVRSYLYTSDLAAWLWTMLFCGAPGRAYNVGSDQAVTVRELAEKIGAPAGLPVEVGGDPQQRDSRYVPSIERARRELGLDVTIPLEEAIRRTIEWHCLHR